MDLDPLIGVAVYDDGGKEIRKGDPAKPLRSRLLAVPALRARYLSYVRTIAENWLDWQKLAPIVEARRALIEKEVEADTRKLDTFDSFKRSLASEAAAPAPAGEPRRGLTLREFADQRRKYLLNNEAVKNAPPHPPKQAKAN